MSGDMTTAQLLAWADKCLGLAADRTDDDAVAAHVEAARGHTQAAVDVTEEDQR